MADEVLSQNEIDALLSALSSGEMDANQLKEEEKEKKIRSYDFKRALRFSKDQVRSLSRIHENYARMLTTYFSAQLRNYVHISVASVDQIPYEEFIRSIPTMTVLNIFSMEPLNGRIIFEINPNVAYAMLDRILGGRGTSLNKIENLTEIESTIMSNLFEKSLDNLQEAWSSVIEIDPMLEEFEVNPQFLQLVSPNETVIVVSLNTTIGETSGMINICIPHVVLEPIIPRLSVHYWMQNEAQKERKPGEYEKLTKNISSTELELSVVLGETRITVENLLELSKGDVLKLNQSIEEPLIMKSSEEPLFYVQPGSQKNNVAVQVIDEIKGGSSDDE
ncbi:flagellar motor switch protein FliM [Halolactibacillus alkaliphilus]|uniref:Flagellar motor switch protein FliM n=1 Tax=Halolactibacillus alkaliphilus TaxID=442899 RepID=A0A511WXV7_9BACI|nr:flagellar motor switch protein FliM [Halolactibacillus alkaliphilus]GEN55787.1 flagellar motor switch protein FliM [Halolactibacillus alkaliphilus]GGN64943.1 flagellar motor switch protein FliM [Halolactibacillus alkaliphilus]SFO64636.1 flagellar motor switch protein FliM [Halolactibacillus alkaliphilus]